MSCVAYDGKIIAADKLSVSADMRSTATKIVRLVDGVILAWVGESGGGLALIDWYKKGSNPDNWPAMQKTENWTRLIVADRNCAVTYEHEPFAQTVEEPFMAWGSGRDFAVAAMAMGADARQAVEIANRFSLSCGGGVDWFDLTI